MLISNFGGPVLLRSPCFGLIVVDLYLCSTFARSWFGSYFFQLTIRSALMYNTLSGVTPIGYLMCTTLSGDSTTNYILCTLPAYILQATIHRSTLPVHITPALSGDTTTDYLLCFAAPSLIVNAFKLHVLD
jgi:hypothetical protein